MPRVLIVAYGNPLRCDDGVAWRAADSLEARFSNAEVEITRLHQLAPETADAVRHSELVLFIDAACIDDVNKSRPGEIQIRKVEVQPHRGPAHFSHVYSPEKVLELAKELYNASPRGFVITVAGEDFGHGDSLSAPVASALPELVMAIERLIKDSNP